MTAHFQNPGARAVAAVRQHLIETKDAGDPFDILTKKFGQHADETLKQLTEARQDVNGLRARFDELDQKMARDGGGSGGYEADT